MMVESLNSSSLCLSFASTIHAYVGAQLENRENLEQFSTLRHHLDHCPQCSKFYMAWYETMRRASEDALPAANVQLTQEIALNALARLSERPLTPPEGRQTRPSP